MFRKARTLSRDGCFRWLKFRYWKKGNKKRATCFETLLQNVRKSDVRVLPPSSNLSCNKSGVPSTPPPLCTTHISRHVLRIQQNFCVIHMLQCYNLNELLNSTEKAMHNYCIQVIQGCRISVCIVDFNSVNLAGKRVKQNFCIQVFKAARLKCIISTSFFSCSINREFSAK